MMTKTRPTTFTVLLTTITATMMVNGCSGPPDERLANYAERATAQQAKQNEVAARQSEAMAQQSQQVADTARQLVEQDAAARRELVHAHEQARAELQKERMSLDGQRQSIEVERQSLATARQRDPIIAESIGAAALLLAALLPLLLAAYALRQLQTGSTDEAVKEMLVRELVEGPLLTERPTPRLPGRTGDDPPRLEQQAPGGA